LISAWICLSLSRVLIKMKMIQMKHYQTKKIQFRLRLQEKSLKTLILKIEKNNLFNKVICIQVQAKKMSLLKWFPMKKKQKIKIWAI
jgi:hypothetical protein